MRVRYTPRAFSDRERIIEYLHERSPVGARKVAASLRDAVAQLREHPRSGYLTNDPGVRVVFLVRYPYKIFYRVRDIIEILHIRHHSLYTPRDFDISPFFAVVKPTIETGFDYKQMMWDKAASESGQDRLNKTG